MSILRSFDFRPINVFGKAEVFILEDGYTTRADPLEGAKTERLEGRLYNVERREIFS